MSVNRRTPWRIHTDAAGALQHVERKSQARIQATRMLRDEEAAGSNPVTPTSITAGHRPIAAVFDLRNGPAHSSIVSKSSVRVMDAVILYGPPAAGKDTVMKGLTSLDARYVLLQRLKVGPGRRDGYAMTTDAALDQLRDDGQVIWENRRYGSRHVVDLPRLRAELAAGHVPVLHLGQPEGVRAVANEVFGSTS